MPLPHPTIVGILNLTPDSFSDGGHYVGQDDACFKIEAMIKDGADMIDIGAESTRPGAVPVTLSEEVTRLQPVLASFRSRFDIPFSVDTTKSEVAQIAFECGATYINDVSAMTADDRMASVIASGNGGVILMHMKGRPLTMQNHVTYPDVVSEVVDYLQARVKMALDAGISEIVVDPGIGFGKLLDHNLAILHHLDRVVGLGYPVMLGASRKSFIGAITGSEVSDRLAGSLATAVWGLERGVRLFRVHDVAHTRHALDVAKAIMEAR